MATASSPVRPSTARAALGIVALFAIAGCTDSVTAPPSAAALTTGGASALTVTVSALGFTGAATAIAPNGLVAGTEYVGTVTHAVLWDDGVVTDLGTAGGESSEATGISLHGQVVGARTTGDGTTEAVLWEGGSATLLPPLPGGSYSSANAISPTGDIVVGESDDSTHDSYHAVLWHDGQVVDLGTIGVSPLGEGSRAFGVNVRGQVVGLSTVSSSYYQHAFLWYDGAMTDLGTLGRTWSVARAVNAAGQVVGHSALGPTRLHSFLWDDGTMTDLGTLGGTSNYAYDINARGQIVGSTQTAEYRSHAYLWYRGVMTDLDASDGPFSAAYAINDAGQIVGSMSTTNSGPVGAVLWTVR